MPKASGELSGSEQTAAMATLSQQAAAWLVGVSARTLRDYHDLPRNADGTYDARQVIAWAARRLPPPDFTDEDTERAIVAADRLIGAPQNDQQTLALHDYLRGLQARFGDAGLAEFVKLLLAEWEGVVGPRREEIQRTAAAPDQAGWRAFNEMRIACVCEACGKLRKGRQWVVAQPPPGYHVHREECPECIDRGRNRQRIATAGAGGRRSRATTSKDPGVSPQM